MIDQFTVGFKTQKKWTWLAAIDFFLGGTGAGVFFLSIYFDFNGGAITGLVVVGLGGLALFLDLGRPERSWRVLSRIFHSWISRGTILTAIFLTFGVLYIVPEWLTGLPWNKETGLGQAIGVLAVLGAIGAMLYTGFLLAHSPSIPFWNTALLPLLFALYAFTSGVGALFILLPALDQSGINIRTVEMMGILFLIGTLVVLWIYMLNMFFSSVTTRESVRLLIRTKLAWSFLVAVNALGLIMPVAMTIIIYFADSGLRSTSAVLTIAGVLMLLGGFLFRYSVLKAGVYPPIV